MTGHVSGSHIVSTADGQGPTRVSTWTSHLAHTFPVPTGYRDQSRWCLGENCKVLG